MATADTHNNKSADSSDIGFMERAQQALRNTRDFTLGTADIYRAIAPLSELINRDSHITEAELHKVVEDIFATLARHPITSQLRGLTNGMRSWNMLPNEQSTEALLGTVMNRFAAISANVVPTEVTDEFWNFFNELVSEPELNGLGEIGLDIARILVNTYEPLLVDTINQLKELRQSSDEKMRQVLGGVYVVRDDLLIFKRQIKALRHIRTFFSIPDDDYKAQAELIAQMVREFGPFFIKIAQVAAANADFLPEDMSGALAVFQEDVEPMSPTEVEQAFMECFNQKPERLYYGFDSAKPLKSGSIASVYAAYRPIYGKPENKKVTAMVPVLLKVGRHNLEREFLIGKAVIKLFILTSQYWAPHSKLTPFLHSWLDQTDIFVEGFRSELDFDAEAENQQRFTERSGYSSGWQVPQVYKSTRRIIEMELIENSDSLNKAFVGLSKKRSRKLRRKIARDYLHAMISHLLIDREFHGDLHQGNVLVRNRKELFFIDWGNTVDIRDIWRPTLNYIKAVLVCDAAGIADSLVAMSPEPDRVKEMQHDVIEIAHQAFRHAGVQPLSASFPVTLIREGKQGLSARLDMAITLMTNLTRKGIAVKGEYMHLSRSVTAMVGSFFGMYQGLSRLDLAQDVMQVWLSFPSKEALAWMRGYSRSELIKRLQAG